MMNRFCEASQIVCGAVVGRLAGYVRTETIKHTGDEERMRLCVDCLRNIAERPPETIHETLRLGLIYYELQKMKESPSVPTGFDRLYYRFYKNDTESGLYTPEQERELIRFFYAKLNGNRYSAGRPLCLGGMPANGEDSVNPLSHVALEIYDELSLPYVKLIYGFIPARPTIISQRRS